MGETLAGGGAYSKLTNGMLTLARSPRGDSIITNVFLSFNSSAVMSGSELPAVAVLGVASMAALAATSVG